METFLSEENPCYEKVPPKQQPEVSTAMAFEEFTHNIVEKTSTEWDECLDYLGNDENSRVKEGLILLYVILVPIYYGILLVFLNALRRQIKHGND